MHSVEMEHDISRQTAAAALLSQSREWTGVIVCHLTYNGPDGDPERGRSHVFMGLAALAYCSLFADGTAKFSVAQVFPVCVYE